MLFTYHHELGSLWRKGARGHDTVGALHRHRVDGAWHPECVGTEAREEGGQTGKIGSEKRTTRDRERINEGGAASGGSRVCVCAGKEGSGRKHRATQRTTQRGERREM